MPHVLHKHYVLHKQTKHLHWSEQGEVKMHVDSTEMVEWVLFCIMSTALLSSIRQVTERQKLISIRHSLFKEFAFWFCTLFVQNDSDEGFADRSVEVTGDCLNNSLRQLWQSFHLWGYGIFRVTSFKKWDYSRQEKDSLVQWVKISSCFSFSYMSEIFLQTTTHYLLSSLILVFA